MFITFTGLIIWGFVTVILLFILISVVLLITTSPYPLLYRRKEEKSYYDDKTGAQLEFDSLENESSINLSVVVPAYNEELRLPPMLEEAIEFLEKRQDSSPNFKYEIIIVSDGSTDKTAEIARTYSKKYSSEKVKCLELIKNRGKGGAVRYGVQSCRGAAILFADADGATKFSDLTKLETSMQQTSRADYLVDLKTMSERSIIVIGSRAHLEEESLASRSVFRNILMYGFHFLVWLFAVRQIKDTQCGFKLFSRKAARICFENLHVERWAFDVELLYIAQKLEIPINEISVNWTEIDGSKVTPVWSWIQMGCDLGLIWLRYKIGAWKIATDKRE